MKETIVTVDWHVSLDNLYGSGGGRGRGRLGRGLGRGRGRGRGRVVVVLANLFSTVHFRLHALDQATAKDAE